jgi:hypothetical protein
MHGNKNVKNYRMELLVRTMFSNSVYFTCIVVPVTAHISPHPPTEKEVSLMNFLRTKQLQVGHEVWVDVSSQLVNRSMTGWPLANLSKARM